MTDLAQGGHPTSPSNHNESDTANDNNDHTMTVAGGVPAPFYYSHHIANVCEAVNAEQKVVHLPHDDMSQADRRRMTNRLSARRRRQRNKAELEQRSLDFRRLTSENESLTAEKARLQQDLLEEEILCIASCVPRVSVERPFQTHVIVQPTLPQQPFHPNDLKSGGFSPSSGRVSNLTASMFQVTDPFAQLRMSGFQGSDAQHHANPALLEAATLEGLQALLATNPFLLAQVEALLASRRLGYQTNGMNLSFTDPALFLQRLQARNQLSILSLLQSTQPVLTASTSSDVQQHPNRSILG